MDNVVSDLVTLYSLRVSRLPRKAPSISTVHWNPPAQDWIKLNTDGLARRNPDSSITDGVFRTCRGFVKGLFSINIGVHTAYFAELLAVILGIELAWEKG